MVENAVDNDMHIQLMKLICQLHKIFIGSQRRVYIVIIDNVVLMVLAGAEDRVQVDAVKSKLLNVLQIFRNATDRTPEPRDMGIALFIGKLKALARNMTLSVGEAVRKDIIYHRILEPFRHLQNLRAENIGILVIFTSAFYHKAVLRNNVRQLL